MQIQFNTDHSIEGSQAMAQRVEAELRDSLDRFADRITRIEVHVTDVNGNRKSDDDKHCVIEARIAGRAPLSVTHAAASIEQAVDGASGKLERALDHAFAKRDGHRHNGVRQANDDLG